MGKRSIEVQTYNCTYCGFESVQLNQIVGQDGSRRYICGECMIKAFDKGLGYEPVIEPEVSEPLSAGSPVDTETHKTK
jgi:uncharacterized ferredoxin-like protein